MATLTVDAKGQFPLACSVRVRVRSRVSSLPADAHHSSSLSAFKTFLKSVDLSKFVQQ